MKNSITRYARNKNKGKCIRQIKTWESMYLSAPCSQKCKLPSVLPHRTVYISFFKYILSKMWTVSVRKTLSYNRQKSGCIVVPILVSKNMYTYEYKVHCVYKYEERTVGFHIFTKEPLSFIKYKTPCPFVFAACIVCSSQFPMTVCKCSVYKRIFLKILTDGCYNRVNGNLIPWKFVHGSKK